jgi:hypothetical protein
MSVDETRRRQFKLRNGVRDQFGNEALVPSRGNARVPAERIVAPGTILAISCRLFPSLASRRTADGFGW